MAGATLAATVMAFSGTGQISRAQTSSANSTSANSSGLQSSIEAFAAYIIRHWYKDPKLKQKPAPQIITGISPDTKVLGGCISINSETGGISHDIGGTSYCPATNTIFVVQSQIKPLYDAFGSAAVGYVLAHEYGHYLQARYNIQGNIVEMELQADCLSGAILGQGFKELQISQSDIIAMAATAYNLGDSSHGTGAQRAYAVYTGLGQSDELSCKIEDMQKLAKGQVKDRFYLSLARTRSGIVPRVTVTERGPNLRSISGSMGI